MSVAVVLTMYTMLIKDKALKKLLVKHGRQEETFSFDESGLFTRGTQVTFPVKSLSTFTCKVFNKIEVK